MSFNYAPSITNVGILNTCSDISEFISYRINNSSPVFLTQNVSAGITAPSSLEIIGQNLVTNDLLKITVYTVVPGPGSNINFFGGQQIAYGSSNHILHYNIDYIGAVGGYIDVDFNCTFVGLNGDINASKTITGFAHVKRDSNRLNYKNSFSSFFI